ncbi:MAG TPA: hypothetical protein VF384_10690 [Planctomycetota bacterium]
MSQCRFALCCLVTTVCAAAVAQQPGATPTPQAPPTSRAPAAQAPKDALLTAFIDADGNRRMPITGAAERVLAMDAAGRAKFMETLRTVAKVAPKPAEPAKPATSPSETRLSKDTAAAATPSAEALEQRRKHLTTLLGGAWLDPADGAAFGETPGYRRLIQMLNDHVRPGDVPVDPPLLNRALAMQAPDMQRGEVVKVRGLVAGVWAEKLNERVLDVTDVWRVILTDSQAEEGVVVDLVLPQAPALNERRDTVEIVGHFYRLVSYEAKGGKTLKVPYLLARSLRVVGSPAAGTGTAGTPAAPTPAAATPAAGTSGAAAPAKASEFADEIKRLMASVVSGTPDEAQAALAKLVEDKQAGPAALQRLDERGKLIFNRCLLTTFSKKMLTNAMYAGQYSDLASFQPEAGQALLRWAMDAPRDAPNPDQFPGACLRALRDVLPTEQATDALRESLRKIATKAQSTNNDLFVGAVCALHQYGDPSIFDKVKEGIEKRATSEDAQQKAGATNMLADLYYNLRAYAEAATHYKALVALIEASGQEPQSLPTVLYNTACVLSLSKNLDESFQYLERALQASAKNRQFPRAMLDEDQDLTNLRADPRFTKLIEQHYPTKAAPTGK